MMKQLLITVLLLCSFVSAQAGIRTWNGSTSADWNNPNNWSPYGIPNASDDVIIPYIEDIWLAPPTYDPTLSYGNAHANSVEVKSQGSLTLSASAKLTINGSRVVSGNKTSFNNYGTVKNYGKIIIGSLNTISDNGLYNRGTFYNYSTGEINIDNSTSKAVYNYSGAFINYGIITIGANAAVGVYGLYNSSTFTNNGNAEINIDNSSQNGLFNESTFRNFAKINIGANSSVGQRGLENNETFNNYTGGKIDINNASQRALYHESGTFSNDAKITIGGGTQGINNNSDFFNNTGGEISIDNTVNIAIFNQSGTFSNASKITIGATGTGGSKGLCNLSTFNNNVGGELSIDNTSSIGLENAIGEDFNNYAKITIGANSYVGSYGIQNKGSFNNTDDGIINIDNSSSAGLSNGGSSAFFTNLATILIGANGSVGTHGLENTSTFNNTDDGIINIDNSSIAGLNNRGSYAVFTNAAKILIGFNASVGTYGIENRTTFNNLKCAELKVKRGDFLNTYYDIFTNRGYLLVANTLINNSTFTNDGVLKYGILSGNSIENATDSSIIVNDSITTFFTYGGTYNGIVNGVYTDETATNSAGIFIAPNNFTPFSGLIGSQVLYAKITPNGGECSYVVPFLTPEINLKANNQNIVNADNTPSTADSTDFGNLGVSIGSNTNTFWIVNDGTSILTLGANPISQIGTHQADFTITQPSQTTLAAGDSVSFKITFDPTALGLRTDTISLINDDNNESPYTFAISGIGTETCITTANPTDLLTWTGAKNTDWNEACNWSPTGIPTATNDVVIPGGMPNQPTLAITNATASTVEVQSGATFTIAASGKLELNGTRAIIISETSTFYNSGEVQNNGKIIIGANAAVGVYGLYNSSTFNNNGNAEINIDNSTEAGLYNYGLAPFHNYAKITIGANTSVGNYGLVNGSTFNNNTGAEVNIDNTAAAGLNNLEHTFTNHAKITIGANSFVGAYGLENNAIFNNNTGGDIKIDKSGTRGLSNENGVFTNAAKITIGANGPVGQYGLYSSATFNNNTGGEINIDNATDDGLTINSGVFTNEAKITLGGIASPGFNGIFNRATFSNNAGGDIKIDNSSGIGFFNVSGTFNNHANVSIGANASIGEYGIRSNSAFNNNLGGEINIDNSTEAGLFHDGLETFQNYSKITIGANALVGKYGLLNESTFNNNAGGEINIDSTTNTGLVNRLALSGIFTNAAKINIGTNASVGLEGISNIAIFNNISGGEINIDNSDTRAFSSTSGIVNNSAKLTIGANAPAGYIGLYTEGIFNNNTDGEITIDSTSSIGLWHVTNTFTNQAKITIGSIASVGNSGLQNSATFNNNEGGEINIDNTNTAGLTNELGVFTNSAKIIIGTNNSIGDNGILNKATFNNNTGGNIGIDSSSNIGLLNQAGSFTNAAKVTIGSNAGVGAFGIFNDAIFNSLTGGEISINNTSAFGIINQNGEFTNAATITIGEIGNGGLWNKSIFNNNGCGKILLKRGKLLVSSGHTYTNIGFTHVIEELENEGIFTNNGILKYGSTTGNPVINTTDSSVIVNDTLSTIFSYGGTFNGTVNGIFTDEAATVSAGTYLIDGGVDFIAACNLPSGTQTLYASITSSSCTTPVIVPFLYNNAVATPTDLLTWTGAVDTVWDNACNWSPTGIPTATNDVVIPGGLSNQPTITIDTAKAGSMKVESGAIFTIAASGKLELYGSKANFNIESYTFINSGTVENNGTLTIGIENFIDDYGLANYFHFNNNVGGEVIIDRSTEAAILNVGTITNDANITIGSNTGIGDYGFYNFSTFNNSICANLKIEQGKFRNNNGTAVTNLGYVYLADTLENEGIFTNDGLLKYGVQTGNPVINTTDSSVIVNDTLSTIFSYGGTYNGTINGIFTDEAATVSAGTFTSPNGFVPLSTLPLGSQTLYAKVTPNGGACSHVVPFLFDNFREIDVRADYVSIANGDMSPSVSDFTDFGIAAIFGGVVSHAFTIVNEGTSTLTLGANPIIKSGPHEADFTIRQPSETTIDPGDSVHFYIIFDPSVLGERNATISIANDDADESPYTFAILGNSFCNTSPTASISDSQNLSCNITSVSRTASGGTSYSWSNGLGTNATANISTAGTYTVTVTAANGCTSTATTEVTIDNTTPTVSISDSQNLSCNITSVTRTASGGTSYSWSNGLGTNAVANISTAGTYTLTVTAANGCSATTTTAVTIDNTPPTPNITGSDNLSCAITSVTRIASGGNSYSWSNGLGTNATANINAAGTYTVTVTAANGCTSTATTEVTIDNTPPTASISDSQNLSCAITSVSRTASGGTSYSWSNGLGKNATANISTAGTYTVTVTAANGCTSTATTEVTIDNTTPTVSISDSQNLSCTITSVSRTASGGNSYSWSNGLGTNATANINAAGTYTVTVTAANGCTSTATTEVTIDNTTPTVSISDSQNLSCNITSVTRTASGGTSYVWSNGLGTNAKANISTAGTYTVTITTANGCTNTATTEVTIDNTPPTASITGTDSLNCTQNTVTRTASGGNSYSWSNGLGTNATTNINAAGTYTVTVTAANGCTSTATTEVVFDNNLVVTASNDGPYEEQETINLIATGGPSYSWTGPDGFTSSLINPSISNASPAKAGIYTVTVTNGSCTGTATTDVVISCSTPGMSYYLAYVYGAEVEVFAPLVSEMEVQATNRRMTVLAIPNCELPIIESTRLQLSGTGNNQFYVDNEAPYSLYENNGATYGDVFETNYYTFIARGYAQDNSQGVVVGPDVIRFSVVPGDREITSPSLSTNVICAGASFTVSSTASGVFSFNVGNVYQAFLSDENGSFENQILIGSSANPNNISCTIPNNIAGGSNYKVIVRSSSPIVSSDASVSLSITSNSVSLLSPTNDILSGTQTEQAIQTINAENKISGTSNVMYKAGNAILLAPGFSTASGNVFSAKIEDVCAE